MNIHVQEYIARSKRVHVFRPAFDNIRSALIRMRSEARTCKYEYSTFDYSADPMNPVRTDHAHMETDNATYIDVVSNGGARRRFTLVTKRGGEPVPFGHLVGGI